MKIVKTKLGERAFLLEGHDSNYIVMALREKAEADRKRADESGHERVARQFRDQAERQAYLADEIERELE